MAAGVNQEEFIARSLEAFEVTAFFNRILPPLNIPVFESQYQLRGFDASGQRIVTQAFSCHRQTRVAGCGRRPLTSRRRSRNMASFVSTINASSSMSPEQARSQTGSWTLLRVRRSAPTRRCLRTFAQHRAKHDFQLPPPPPFQRLCSRPFARHYTSTAPRYRADRIRLKPKVEHDVPQTVSDIA